MRWFDLSSETRRAKEDSRPGLQGMVKIVTYTPETHIDLLINAMSEAGAGIVGEYTHNAFILRGEGNWFSPEGTNPTVGAPNSMSREPEARIEMTCPDEAISTVIKAITSNHPYETPAIDVYQLYTAD